RNNAFAPSGRSCFPDTQTQGAASLCPGLCAFGLSARVRQRVFLCYPVFDKEFSHVPLYSTKYQGRENALKGQ
ncbi:MAG: hypothetical protein SO188_16495, partial [Prevotella sp.]|nr:hypothetical protein [Prevotella sp.]